MERHLGFAVKIVTICEKKKIVQKKIFFMNLVQPKRFCVWNQSLQQMRGEENVAFDQDVIQPRAKAAIKAANSFALSACPAPSASELLIISARLIAQHLNLSSTLLHSDNNCPYLQVQKQDGSVHGCCQPYQLCSAAKETTNRYVNKRFDGSDGNVTKITSLGPGLGHTCGQ